MSNILITGGLGFVGANLAVRFADKGHKVICFDNLVRRGSELNLKRVSNRNNITFIHGDIRNTEDFINIPSHSDVVLECAAQPTVTDGYENPVYDVTNNTYGLVNVLEYCRKQNAGLIFWSTNKTYSGDLCNSVPHVEDKSRYIWIPDKDFSLNGWTENGFNTELNINGTQHSIYGVSKVAADLICQEFSDAFKIPLIINRFSCIYGPHQFGKVSQGWIVWFVIAKLLNKDLTFFGTGKQVRDYLYIDDLFNLVEKQVENINKHYGSYYNVGGGRNNTISLVELNEVLDILLGTKSTIDYKSARRADQDIYISDIRDVCNDFDWEPKVDFNDGIKKVIEWARDNIVALQGLYE